MKLLVFAHTPPPVHGQSIMVEILLAGLARERDFELFHVNPRISRDAADIGRWRLGKVFALAGACLHAITTRLRHGGMYFYYVPAPARRAAVYRDWLVMLLCRPFFRGLILHWHAAGLGEWLSRDASAFERAVTQQCLGGAALAIVLGEALRADANLFSPRQVAVIRNGLPDPCPDLVRRPRVTGQPLQAVFLGLCIPEKGLLDAVAAVAEANRRANGRRRIQLTVAGEFPTSESRAAFDAAVAASGADAKHIGFVSGSRKRTLLAEADVLLFPTYYPHETQGLVVAEALAHDLPVIVTRWRAVHEDLPAAGVHTVEPHRPDQIAQALLELADAPPGGGRREHFLARLTDRQHVASLATALRAVAGEPRAESPELRVQS